jgi:hypothetical protein
MGYTPHVMMPVVRPIDSGSYHVNPHKQAKQQHGKEKPNMWAATGHRSEGEVRDPEARGSFTLGLTRVIAWAGHVMHDILISS